MKFSKEGIVKTSMKMLGTIAIFVGAIVIMPTSLLLGHEPKCPDDLLK
jgi:cyclic lactone autoinducer peptide